MSRYLFIWMIFCMIGLNTFADTTSRLNQAAEAYYQKDFQSAEHMYEDVLKRYPHHPILLYNLGHVYAQQSKLGKARYAYHQAYKYLPRDPDILNRLEAIAHAQLDKRSIKGPNRHKLNDILSILSLKEWGYIVLIVGSVCNVFALLWMCVRYNIVLKQCLFFSIGLLCIVGVCFILRWSYDKYSNIGVIVDSKIAMTAGPSEVLPILMYLHDGKQVYIERVIPGWVKIKIENKIVGWIQEHTYWKL